MDIVEKEARIFTNYLVGRDASSQAIQLYKIAMNDSKPDDTDKKLLRFMLKHPSTIGLIDAGLVFHNSNSEARRRLYVMQAILEASTLHHDLFLPKKRSPLYMFVIFYSGMRAVIKAGLGLLLVKAIS
jgi:hypothetical protein